MIGADFLAHVVAVAPPAILVGLIVGLAYFRGLRFTANLFVEGRGWALLLALTLVRLAGVIAVLLLAVRFGAVALMACFLGFLMARMIAVRSAARVR